MRKQLPLADISATGDRRLRFTISTGAIDRDSDTLDPEGWDLTEYRQNPVVLFSHDASGYPVGKSVAVDISDGVLWAEVEFLPVDIPEAGPRAEAVYRMCLSGFLNAASVGFHPVDFEFSADRMDDFGIDFRKQKLLEWSIVTVPANPEALIEPQTTQDDPNIPVTTPDPSLAGEGTPKAARDALIRSLSLRARASAV
ncbi:hypothetical protein AA21952_0127 [Acetobacter oeni LMG 21952]|nr:hypothetical protein AA21952_0127 [Acetobacter oeni LMG 21952]